MYLIVRESFQNTLKRELGYVANLHWINLKMAFPFLNYDFCGYLPGRGVATYVMICISKSVCNPF